MAGQRKVTETSGCGVEEDGHRPVVDERHLHVGGEDAGLDPQALAPQRGAEVLIEALSRLGGRGAGEADFAAVAAELGRLMR